MFDAGKLKLFWLVEEEEDTFASACVAVIRANGWTFPVYYSYRPSICAPPQKKKNSYVETPNVIVLEAGF